jgi:peptidoglycan/xylan/chitin deacetylase (PgdA/CDA1 family)
MDLEEKYGAKSTFFFKAYRPVEQEYKYNIGDIVEEVGAIIDRGWEVGLHGGHTAYLNPDEMREKREWLEKVTGKPVTGYRNHYLRFRVPETWEYLSQAGFRYDATLGYADCAGFRNGMCHPFRPFNLNTGREIDIVEISLVVMDGTLDQTYMRFDRKGTWEFVKMLIDRVAACHGVFTILWHNTYMEGENLGLYEKILRYCRKRRAWMTSCVRVYTHFLK